MVIGMEHLAILSANPARLAKWYETTFGAECVLDNGKGTYFMAFRDKSMLEIFASGAEGEYPQADISGLRHIALSTDDFSGDVAMLKEKNVEVIADAKTSASGISTFFFRDIDGNILHLISRPAPLV
ncbi:MAG: VOC family protein [Clostridia bacterium]|nr:VOC family protein [Clostridia bacterium]